ncbi:hypothetical protein SteCoe_32546 [Stentor coeruleus]|uniref:Peptidase M1 leukotriene A4 hydrolase/aminopeptidase C-terminal domain-containing protein n=1 Tax=Stentor coeruleus TaxID=5963 RepID=A0A1R2AZ66_9CILI|nr:hypothetical protein SteCoe_32546 [Stentor coeruleus]
MDPCSKARPSEASIKHIDFTVNCDLRSQTVYGRALYTYESNSASNIILDLNHIEIASCSNSFSIIDESPVFGKTLSITIDNPKGTFSINYKTLSSATAIQYLDPSQTSGKVLPFCFTQCQAIHCRSLLPIQDTPQVKFTIDYHIHVTQELTAVAGGIFQSVEDSIPGYKVYNFKQNIPIPSYLVAFAIGNIHSLDIGPVSKVYAEPELLDKSAFTFGDIDILLKAAEKLMTPYFWGRLDMIVLPPSFPFGGMENPNLIFVTPTVISGDKSLVNLLAHEIAHSWTGNAVTNSTWEHFWLNEGFTTFFERKIVREVYGQPQADIQQSNGLECLRKSIGVYGENHNFTRLNLDNDGYDPDDAFSSIPYEKGCCFLLYLESLVGENELMSFLKDYVTKYTGKTITSEEFKEYFIERFTVNIDWDTWLRGTGMPPWLPTPNNTLLEIVNQAYSSITEGNTNPSLVNGWCTEQYVSLLNLMLKNPKDDFIHAGELLNINLSQNAEIKVLWLDLTIRTKQEKYFYDVENFLCSQGRMKFVRPLFRSLKELGFIDFAYKIFEKCRNFYHSTLVTLLSKEFNFQ